MVSVINDAAASELLQARREEICLGIRETVDSVLASMEGCGLSESRWKHKATKKGISYYVDEKGSDPGHYRFCCMGSTPATADEVISLFDVGDKESFQRRARIIYANMLDMRVLTVLDPPTQATPFKSTYVRYTSLAAPVPLNDRDLCVAVATDVFTQNDDGATIGYCLWDSIEYPECPGFVRGKMFRSGYLCRTAHNASTTEIIYFVNVDAGGPIPRLTSWLIMEKFGANLLRLCNHFRRKRLNPATFCPREQWPASRKVTHCRSCVKKFTGLSKRPHCSACGLVFCSVCCSKEEVDLPGVGITSLPFCHMCLAARGLVSRRKLSVTSDRFPRRVQSEPTMRSILDDSFYQLQLHSNSSGSNTSSASEEVVSSEWCDHHS